MSSSSNNEGFHSGSGQGQDKKSSGSGSKTKYAIIKEGWGSRRNFQASYGLPMTPEGFKDGNAILDEMRKHDDASDEPGKK